MKRPLSPALPPSPSPAEKRPKPDNEAQATPSATAGPSTGTRAGPSGTMNPTTSATGGAPPAEPAPHGVFMSSPDSVPFIAAPQPDPAAMFMPPPTPVLQPTIPFQQATAAAPPPRPSLALPYLLRDVQAHVAFHESCIRTTPLANTVLGQPSHMSPPLNTNNVSPVAPTSSPFVSPTNSNFSVSQNVPQYISQDISQNVSQQALHNVPQHLPQPSIILSPTGSHITVSSTGSGFSPLSPISHIPNVNVIHSGIDAHTYAQQPPEPFQTPRTPLPRYLQSPPTPRHQSPQIPRNPHPQHLSTLQTPRLSPQQVPQTPRPQYLQGLPTPCPQPFQPPHPVAPPTPSPAPRVVVPPDYDHYQAMREFSLARRNGNRITIDTSPTFSGRGSATPRRVPTLSPSTSSIPSSSPSVSTRMPPPRLPTMQPTHRYGHEVQQPSQVGPIRTSGSRGAFNTQPSPRRPTTSRRRPFPGNPSPTVPAFGQSRQGSRGYSQSTSSHNHSQGQSHSCNQPGPGHYTAGPSHVQDQYNTHTYNHTQSGSHGHSTQSHTANYDQDMSPTAPMFPRTSYRDNSALASNQLRPFQYPCLRDPSVEASRSAATRTANPASNSAGTRMPPPPLPAPMSPPLATPGPTGPTWATAPGSAALPPPYRGQATPARRHNMNIAVTHASAFEPRRLFPTPAQTPLSGPVEGARSSPTPAPGRSHTQTHATGTHMQAEGHPQVHPHPAAPSALSSSLSPTPAMAPAPPPPVSTDPNAAAAAQHSASQGQVAAHLQIMAAHVGLDVHFTPKMQAPGKGRAKSPKVDVMSKLTPAATPPPPSRSATPRKFTPPGTSGGKNSRRASFATLLPSSKAAKPKRSRPGQWTLEKRLIFVDRLITAGYKSLSLCDLANELELKKKQLVNQLTPGRTGSIRELCMNAAARVMDQCPECKKKQAGAKHRADGEGLAEFLLRGVGNRVIMDVDDDIDGEEWEEEEGACLAQFVAECEGDELEEDELPNEEDE